MTQQSKPLQNQPQKEKTIQQLINDFCQDLEKGDFGLSKIIRKGYLVYGQTRSGKTAASHLLSGNALKGVKIGGDEKVETSTSKHKNAKIGNTPVSQTRVPNIFQVKDPNNPQETAYVIDTPGYGDTNGTFRILGNGYYHYKLYSKVQNMKFILCFDSIQLNNTAQLFIDTIVQFTSYFKDYKQDRHQIWKSCVFLINKVDQTSLSIKDLKDKISQIEMTIQIHKKKQQIVLIKQFIRYILDNDKLFTIKKYKLGESATRADLLKSIDQKAEWWFRETNPDKQDQIEMSKILFNITKPIILQLIKNELSKQHFMKLIDYYNQRVSQILKLYDQTQTSCSLDYIFNSLIKDAMGKPDSHSFLDLMKMYVDKYYHIYDTNYKEQREKFEKQLFENDKNPQQVTQSKIKDKNFIVKKFKLLQTVQARKVIMREKDYEEEDDNTMIEKIGKLSKALYEMIKDFKNVAYKRSNCSGIIYKYGYIIYRVISEAQVLLLLMSGAAGDKDRILNAADNKFFVLKRPLVDFVEIGFNWNGRFGLHYQQLRDTYIKNINLNSEQFKNLTINWSLIDLFSENSSEQPDPIVVEKVIILLEKFSQQFLSEKQSKQQNIFQTNKLINRLAIARVNCSQLYELSQSQDRKYQLFFIIRRITQNIGKLLQSAKSYDLARKVYNSILYVDGVCNLYQIQIEELNHLAKQTPKTDKPFRLRIQYANYLKNHGREKQTIIILQQAFELASNRNELEDAKKLLSDALLQKSKDGSSYEKQLFENNLFEKFDDQLIDQLENLGTNSYPPSQIMAGN